MLEALALANGNVTGSVGDDGLAAFDVGTSVAAAATNVTKPRRFLDMCGLLWRKLPWLPNDDPVGGGGCERDDAGRVLPPSFVLRAHRPLSGAATSPGRVGDAPARTVHAGRVRSPC
jgi:hypothetical protein